MEELALFQGHDGRGRSGVGEGCLNYFAKTVQGAIHELEHLVLGMNPMQIEIISQLTTAAAFSAKLSGVRSDRFVPKPLDQISELAGENSRFIDSAHKRARYAVAASNPHLRADHVLRRLSQT